MNSEKKNPYTPKQLKGTLLVFIFILSAILFYALSGLINAFFGALIIYTLFRQLHIRLIEKKKWRKSWSTALIMIISFLIIIMPLTIIVYQVAVKVTSVKINATTFETASKKLKQPPFDKWIDTDTLSNQAEKIVNLSAKSFSSVLNSISNGFLVIGIMYLILYFALMCYKEMEDWLFKYAPFSNENTLKLAIELRNITFSNVIGSGITATVQGVLVGIGFWIFDIPEPFIYGLIAIFAAFIPVVGAALIFVPGSIYALLTDHVGGGIGMLAWGFILVANIDNVIRLFINKQIGNTHPLVTFLGIIVGLGMFGILGLVMGPLLISYLVLLVQIYTETYLNKKPVSINNIEKEAESQVDEQ